MKIGVLQSFFFFSHWRWGATSPTPTSPTFAPPNPPSRNPPLEEAMNVETEIFGIFSSKMTGELISILNSEKNILSDKTNYFRQIRLTRLLMTLCNGSYLCHLVIGCFLCQDLHRRDGLMGLRCLKILICLVYQVRLSCLHRSSCRRKREQWLTLTGASKSTSVFGVIWWPFCLLH